MDERISAREIQEMIHKILKRLSYALFIWGLLTTLFAFCCFVYALFASERTVYFSKDDIPFWSVTMYLSSLVMFPAVVLTVAAHKDSRKYYNLFTVSGLMFLLILILNMVVSTVFHYHINNFNWIHAVLMGLAISTEEFYKAMKKRNEQT